MDFDAVDLGDKRILVLRRERPGAASSKSQGGGKTAARRPRQTAGGKNGHDAVLGMGGPQSGDADGADLWPNNHGFAMADCAARLNVRVSRKCRLRPWQAAN